MGKYEVTQAQWEAVMGNNPSCFKSRDNPVETVSWDMAQEFIKRLNKKEGHARYRLPTEAQWEYAARGGSTSVYSFGDDAGQLRQYAWYGEDYQSGSTHPVGQKPHNAWGLYDMHGNVCEWVQDWYGERYYSNSPSSDPKGPSSGSHRVLRGGGWYDLAIQCRSAYRDGFTPVHRDAGIGFRLVLSPE
jgi:formylglycine-generating enzyme required for sulfatase activity